MKEDPYGRLPLTTFRLSATTLAELELIQQTLTEDEQHPTTRAEALRFAVRETAKRIRKKSSEKA